MVRLSKAVVNRFLVSGHLCSLNYCWRPKEILFILVVSIFTILEIRNEKFKKYLLLHLKITIRNPFFSDKWVNQWEVQLKHSTFLQGTKEILISSDPVHKDGRWRCRGVRTKQPSWRQRWESWGVWGRVSLSPHGTHGKFSRLQPTGWNFKGLSHNLPSQTCKMPYKIPPL